MRIIITLLIFLISAPAFADHWRSETFNIESIERNRMHRIYYYEQLKVYTALVYTPMEFWTDSQMAIAKELWQRATVEQYVPRMKELEIKLSKLTDSERRIYFREIGMREDTDYKPYVKLP